ncbi:MAG: hypothetical protein RML56_13230 [Burkholderiales bacterium]|nr:hypothetical protein [Burkholderiales bacterium]
MAAFDGKFGPVGAQRREVRPRAHHAARAPGAAEFIDVRAVRGAKACRDEAVERGAERLLAPPAEHRFRGAVEEHDALLVVHREDRVHRRIDHAFELRLGAPDRGALRSRCAARAAR